MAVPVYRSVGAKSVGTTAAVTVALPSGLQLNDICILTATTIAGATITITTSGSISWTAITDVNVTGGDRLYCWWGRYSSGTTAPKLTASSDHLCAGIVAYSGCITTGTPYSNLATGTETTSDTSFSFATGQTTTTSDNKIINILSSGVDSDTGQGGTFTNSSLTSIVRIANYNTTSGGGGGFAFVEGTQLSAGSMGTWACTMVAASPKAFMSFALLSPQALALERSSSDSTSISDSFSYSIGRSLEAALNDTDSANDNKFGGSGRLAADSASVLDSKSFSTIKAYSDVMAAFDARGVLLSRAMTSVMSVIDSRLKSYSRLGQDTATFNDALSKSSDIARSELKLVSDIVSKSIGRLRQSVVISADSRLSGIENKRASFATSSDNTLKYIDGIVADYSSISDSLSMGILRLFEALEKSINDNLSLSDISVLELEIRAIMDDIISIIDSVAYERGKILSESILLLDEIIKDVSASLYITLDITDDILYSIERLRINFRAARKISHRFRPPPSYLY